MTESLYQRIGEKGLESLLNGFYDCVFSNDILLPLFNHTSRDVIQRKQLMFLSQFLGGPMLYTNTYGAPRMRQRHLPHKISPKGRDAWLLCMKNAVNEQDWDDRLKDVVYNIFPPIANHMINSSDE